MAFDTQLASSYPPLVLYTLGAALRALSLDISTLWTDRDIGRSKDDDTTVRALQGVQLKCRTINNALSRVVMSPIGVHREVITEKEMLVFMIHQLVDGIIGRISSIDRIAMLNDDAEYLESKHLISRDFYLFSDFPLYEPVEKPFLTAMLP